MLRAETISKLYPIGAIALYSQVGVARILRLSDQMAAVSPKRQTKRGEVRELTTKSLNRLNFLVQTTSVELKSMLTLTYLCPPPNGRKSKKDLGRALAWLKRRGKDVNYVWFAEFTKMGYVHFHILLDFVPNRNDRLDLAFYWLKKTEQGAGEYCQIKARKRHRVINSIFSVVAHPNSWDDIRDVNGAKKYVAMYATKPYQKEVPFWYRDNGRWWGVSKGITTSRLKPRIVQLNESELREILSSYGHKVANWDVMPRYLWGATEQMFEGI